MPLFEVEGDRPQLVTGRGSGVGTTAHRVVESHIDGLLGEQVFPVSPGAGPDEPHLLALDASGAPVVVELIARLDDAALSRALDHAGAAGRMTRGQLASLYRGGPQAFHRDIAAFYDSVPVKRSQPGRTGVRLIIICQDADETVLNAVDFLRQPSMPVEVLRLGLVHGAEGRRFVDVSPLVIHPASAPDRPELVAHPEGVAPLTGRLPVVVDGDDRHDQGQPIAAVPLPGVAVPTPPADEPARPRTAPVAVVPASTPDPVGSMPVAGQPGSTSGSQGPTPVTELPGSTSTPVAPGAARSEVVSDAAARTTVRRRSRTDRFAAPAASAAPAAPAPLAGGAQETRNVDAPGRRFAGVGTPGTRSEIGTPGTRSAADAPGTPGTRSDVDAPATRSDDGERPSGAYGVETTATLPPVEVDEPYRFPDHLSLGPSSPHEDPLAWRPARAWDPESGEDPIPAPPPRVRDALAFGEVFGEVSSPLESRWDARTTSSDPAPWEPPFEPPRLPEPAAPAPWEPERQTASTPIVLDEETDPDLAALAADLRVPTALLWERPRRRQRFEAVLNPDGTIELADGSRYRHPDVAASAASGSYTADGWSVWRLRATGESLAEAFRARFA